MKRKRGGSTIKQYAYATRMMNGQAGSKKEAALLSGFSMTTAKNATHKIEKTEGFRNAVEQLAYQSNNLLLAIMAEFTSRGFTNFSNKDLVAAINAVTSAWSKIDDKRAPSKLKTPEGNPLRKVFTERVETRTAIFEETPAPLETPMKAEAIDVTPNPDMDF